MGFEDSGWSKFSEFMADHILSNKDRNKLSPIMDGKSVAHELWENGGATRPSAEHPFIHGIIHALHSLNQIFIHERSFFDRTRHELFSPRDNIAITLFLFSGFLPLREHPPRRARMTAPC